MVNFSLLSEFLVAWGRVIVCRRLSSFVIDRVLMFLPRDVFVDFRGAPVTAFAYADELNFLSSTIPGLQLPLSAFERQASEYSLSLNPGKCFAFSLVPLGKRKTFQVLTDRQFHLSYGSIHNSVPSPLGVMLVWSLLLPELF